MSVAQNPTNMILYQAKYFDEQPRLTADGYVENEKGNRFVIVHQYDRTNSWKNKIMEKYND
jgi:hypothetical protein